MENILKQNSDLVLAIKKVIVFFDLFDYPLTVLEIYNYLNGQFLLTEIIMALDLLIGVIDNEEGFYFLLGREELVALRKQRYNYSVRKLKIAKRYARIFATFPGVRVVTLANVIGAHNMRDEGDIDYFIICRKNRIWLCRLFCAGLAKMLNKRPTQILKKDKLCLSFYISDDHLNLDNLKITPYDPYFEYWLSTMTVLANKGKVYEDFLAANNIKYAGSDLRAPKLEKRNKILDNLEYLAKLWQLKIMSPALKQVLISSKGKFINDQILKLYWRDRNAEILEKYNYVLNQII